ncbi:hypothetical protein [Brevundimonas sp.]|uniref:hypothetical protein n=1 Tax=Brevundimonas sp. TaxID=1871086 RepID=UPI0035B04459
MARWAWMLGGLIVWAIHFLGVYVIASLGDVVDRADALEWRMAGLAFSGLCVAVVAMLLFLSLRRLRQGEDEPNWRFREQLAALGAFVSLVSIVWQALPTVIGY